MMNLHQHIHEFMSKEAFDLQGRLLVVRGDGVLVWDAKNDHHSQSLAALTCAVWEASAAMAQAAGKVVDHEFRFVFDTSEQGVVIFPVRMYSPALYLTAVYQDVTNPAYLKRKVKMLGDKLSDYIEKNKLMKTSAPKVRDGYLFSDITDAEMDRLFGL